MRVGYKIGYAIGWCFSKVCGGIYKLLWCGTVTASKDNKYLLITYICLLVALFPSSLFFHNISVIICIIFILGILFGIAEQLKEKPIEDRKEYFNAVFEEINLKYNNESVPEYLYEKELSEYATLFAFNSFIPVTEWQKKRDSLEILLNVKILDIKQDKENNRIVHLITEMKPLSTLIEWDNSYINRVKDILNIGMGHYGIVGIDLNKYPHMLVAGETNSGKSNILKCLIYQSLEKKYEVILIDFKRAVSFSEFGNKIKVYFEYEETVKILDSLVDETKNRLDLLRKAHVEDFKQYNQVTSKCLRRKIIFIDELAELLKTRDKVISNSLYDNIETLARIARAVGIHLIVGIQRPDSTILNGQIKNNLSFRVCGHFTDPEPSRIVLSNALATSLLDIKGRFIANANGYQEVQCFYYNNNFIKENTTVKKDKKDTELLHEIEEFVRDLEKSESSDKESQIIQEDSFTILINKFNVTMQKYCSIVNELHIVTDNINEIESSDIIQKLINVLSQFENVKNIFDNILDKFEKFDSNNLLTEEEICKLDKIDMIYSEILEIMAEILVTDKEEIHKKIAHTNELIDSIIDKDRIIKIHEETTQDVNLLDIKEDKVIFDFSNIKK